MEKDLNTILSEADRMVSESSERLKSVPNDKAFGIRDALLVKCRDTIENLNIELDEEKRCRRHLESKLKDLEHSNGLLEDKLRQQESQMFDLSEELELSVVSNEQYKAELKKFQSLKSVHEAQTHMQSTLKSLEHSLATVQEENAKLKQQLENERARPKEYKTEQSDSLYFRDSYEEERMDLEKIELELEELYEKKHKCMIKDFEKKQEALREELTVAIDEIEIERERYHELYKTTVEENTQLRQEIKYLQSMLQRKQSQLEKHSQQSLDQLQSIMEKKGNEESLAYKVLISELEKEKNFIDNQKTELENQKIELENEIFSLREMIKNSTQVQERKENFASETSSLKQKVNELKSALNDQVHENKNLLQETDGETNLESRKVELVKIKYQNLIQSELQKRLRDKQEYKQHLIQDKEAFLSKLKMKDDKIEKLEAEKNELINALKNSEENITDSQVYSREREKRIMAEDTARVFIT